MSERGEGREEEVGEEEGRWEKEIRGGSKGMGRRGVYADIYSMVICMILQLCMKCFLPTD